MAVPADQLIQTATGLQTPAQFYGVTEIEPPVSNVATVPSPVDITDEEKLLLAGFREVTPSAEDTQLPGFTETDPLDALSEEELVKDKNFEPVVYFNTHGEGAMDTKKLEKLKTIFKERLREGVSGGGLVGAAGRTVKGAVIGIPHMIKGLAEATERAVIRPVVGMAAGAVSEFLPGADARREIIGNWIDSGLAELVGGAEADAVGLSEAVRTGLDKAAIAAKGKKLTDEEAGQILFDWAARTKQAEAATRGEGATFNVAEAAKAEGVEIAPEAIQNVAAGGPLSLVALGGTFKIVTQAGKALISAPTKTAAMQAFKRAQQQVATAQTALTTGPATAAKEVALQTAIKAAEATPKPLVAAVAERIPSVETVTGRGLQAAGAITERITAPAMQLGARALRATRPLGIPLGSIFGVPLAVAGRVAERVGAAVKGLGREVASEAPGVAAQRVQDVIKAAQSIAVPTAVGTAIDTGFAVGTAKTDEEAQNMPGIAGALGFAVGLPRAAGRVIAGEQLAPRKGAFPKTESAAYGENSNLDAAHQQAMAASSPEFQNQVNFVRETARKLGGRVYVMPDEAAFRRVLDDLWRAQNGGAEVPPEISKSHAQWAKQNGLFSSSILGPDGQPQNVAFVRDPAALAHEGLGHILEKTLPDEVNNAMDAAIHKSISPENWERAGQYYAERLTQQPTTDWRQTLRDSGIDIDPNIYLAREFRAENLDVAFRNRGEAFATAPDLYNRITGWLGKLAEKVGLPFGAQSEALGLPTSIVEARRGERAARRVIESESRQALVEARDVRLRREAGAIPPETPAIIPPKAVPEIQEAKDWIDANPQKVVTPESGNAGKTIADAIKTGQPVKVAYWAAEGIPAGEKISMRPERRAEIEAARQADNSNRQLVEHNFTPYRIVVTKASGPQFIGWSQDILNSNVAKFNEWLKKVPDRTNVPYETDANGLTGQGMVDLKADIDTYMANQTKGFTGSGLEPVVPEAAKKLGAFAPDKTGTPVPLDQAKADVINYLFNTKIPESASRLAPLHLAGQEVSAATLPGRIEIPIRPRGEYSEATLKKVGIVEPKGVREVNPFRQWVESQTGEKPSLIEVNQRLNLNRIEQAETAVGARPVEGNVLLQAAGFQPKGVPIEGMKRLVEMSQEEWKALTDSYKGRLGSNLTGWAWDVGASAKTAEDVMALRQAALHFQEASKLAMAAARESAEPMKAMNLAMELVGRGQAAREAFEAATGSNLEGTNIGSAVPAIRKYVDPNYEPPVPAKGIAEAAQPAALIEERTRRTMTPAGNLDVQKVAETYSTGAKIPLRSPGAARPVPEETARKIADFYEDAASSPDSPEVQASYKALIDETVNQYKDIRSAGYTIEPFTGKGEPYPNSAAMLQDIRENKHLFYLPTQEAFGKGETAKNLMLEPVEVDGRSIPANDVFRAVHDFFGHAKQGLQFGPKGEFNAWREHSGMYSDEAQGALAAETLAQNFWVNRGRHLRDTSGRVANRGEPGYVEPAERPFAEQKNIVIPDELIKEAAGQQAVAIGEAAQPAKKKSELKLKAPGRDGISKAWVLPSGQVKQLGSQWHHDWLADNEKTYGIKTGSAEDAKIDALKQGFVRLNYSQNTGTLTIEGRASDWRKQKGSVYDTIERNLGDIDNVSVTLFDNGVTKVVDSDRSALFNLESDKEKLASLPFITKEGGEIRGGIQFQPSEQGELSAIQAEVPERIRRPIDLTAFEKAKLTNKQKAKMWPEVVVPKKGNKTIGSDLLDSPLAEQAGSREAAVQAFADGLVKMANEWKDHPVYQAGVTWYKEVVPLLKEEFGADAPLFAELLAATSPQTNVSTNFRYATEALKNFKAGRYDKMVAKFEEGLRKLEDGTLRKEYERDLAKGKVKNPPETPADPTYLAHYVLKHDLIPRDANGKRYGLHSFPVLKVFARRWLTQSDAPKTLNFVQNLAGTGKEATIDLWADRTMRRIGYQPFESRWRILPEHARGPVEAEFRFSQEAFSRAAEQLGLEPMDLQAALWFSEKQLWQDNGWSKLDLGNFRAELKKYQAEEKAPEQLEILPRRR